MLKSRVLSAGVSAEVGSSRNEHLQLPGRQSACDFDELQFGDRQAGDEAARIEIEAELAQIGAARAAHRAAIDRAEARTWIIPLENVLRHVEMGEQFGILVDGGDAGRARFRRRLEADLPLVEEDLARLGRHDAGDDLDQRRLAGAVFADRRVNAALAQIEADVREHADRPVGFLDPCHAQGDFGAAAHAGAPPEFAAVAAAPPLPFSAFALPRLRLLRSFITVIGCVSSPASLVAVTSSG